MWDRGGRSLADLPAETRFFQVPLVVEHLALTRRADRPPDTVAAYLPSPTPPWGD